MLKEREVQPMVVGIGVAERDNTARAKVAGGSVCPPPVRRNTPHDFNGKPKRASKLSRFERSNRDDVSRVVTTSWKT